MKTMEVNLKHIIMCCLMFVIVDAVFAQDYQAKHEVRRGETLASIAKQYGVTEQMIKNANPQMGDLFYVGLKLNIPYINNLVEKRNNDERNDKSLLKTQKEYNAINKNSINVISKNDSWICYLGLSLNKYINSDEEGCSNNTGFHLSVIRHNYISEKIFYEIGLGLFTKGYKEDVSESSGSAWDDYGPNYDYNLHNEMRTYNIELPFYVGYDWVLSSDGALYLKGGGYLTYALFGEKKVTGTLEDWEDIHSSTVEHLDEKIKIDDIDGYRKLGYGVQIGVGYRKGNLLYGFTYQRGLSKLVDGKKIYEQNLLFSLGYNF